MFFRIISILGSMTFVSRILGYIRDLLIAKIIGAGLISDSFFVAFKLPNLFRRLLAEGSMNSAFIPVISGIKGKKNADEFFSKVFSGLVVILFFLLIIFEIFMPLIIKIIAPGFSENQNKYLLTIDFSRLAFPFVFFVCLTSLMGAYLNTLGKFAAMAATPILLNLTMILFLLIFSRNNGDEIYISSMLSFSISFAGIVQFIWLIYNLKKNNILLKLKFLQFFKFRKFSNNSKRLLSLLIPAIIGNGAYQLNLLIDMILASTLPDGSISYLYYADRINQLPLGVLGIAISTALLPMLSLQIKEKDFKGANKSISTAINFGLILSLPAAAGLFVLSNEVISFLFLRGAFDIYDSNSTSNALVALSLGLPAFIMIKILVVPFFANEDTKTPIRISIISMVINLCLNLILIKKFLHVGLAMATSISAWANAFILLFILIYRKIVVIDRTTVNVFLKVVICTFLMAAIVDKIIEFDLSFFSHFSFLTKNNLTLLFAIFSGMIVYIVMIYLSDIKEIKEILWKKKIKRKN